MLNGNWSSVYSSSTQNTVDAAKLDEFEDPSVLEALDDLFFDYELEDEIENEELPENKGVSSDKVLIYYVTK